MRDMIVFTIPLQDNFREGLDEKRVMITIPSENRMNRPVCSVYILERHGTQIVQKAKPIKWIERWF